MQISQDPGWVQISDSTAQDLDLSMRLILSDHNSRSVKLCLCMFQINTYISKPNFHSCVAFAEITRALLQALKCQNLAQI